jgi:hypothetical protein
MFKKIELWLVLIIVIIFFIITLFYGALLKYHYSGGKSFQSLQKIGVFFAQIPSTTKNILLNKYLKSNDGKKNIIDIAIEKANRPPKLVKNLHLPKFKKFIQTDENRNALLILPRFDGDEVRSIVEIIDINTFEVLHTYKLNIKEFVDLIDEDILEFKLSLSHRFRFLHPIILNDGSLISDSNYTPMFKIDFCSKLKWINQEESFHHSKMFDEENNIWSPIRLFPYSDYVAKHYNIEEYRDKNGDISYTNLPYADDGIGLIDSKNGKFLFRKSVSEILAENEIIRSQLFKDSDPIHLNDIEEAFKSTKFWNKNDLFLSARNLNAIIHYRPSENKVINYIQGPFYLQHDVDLISDKEISIFNNNVSNLKNSKFSEILIYNFETKSFYKKFNDELMKENFKTSSEGLSEILNDGSMLVEEQNHGRLIFFNKNGKKEWEFVNKDSNGDIYFISWSRIIEDKDLISKLKSKIENTTCLN